MSIALKNVQVLDESSKLIGTSGNITFSPEPDKSASTRGEDYATRASRITAKHYRLELLMGDEYANQMIIVLHRLSQTGREAYEDLLDQALYAAYHAYNGYSLGALGVTRK